MSGSEAATFGRLLRSFRVTAGLTQEELAQRAGMSGRSVSQLERGRVTRPRMSSVRQLIAALGLEEADAQRLRHIGSPSHDDVTTAPAQPVVDTAGPGVQPAQLPPDVIGFTGRDSYLQQMNALIAARTQPRVGGSHGTMLVSVVGMAGSGKTGLAVHWAHSARPAFTDGQLFVNLNGYAPAEAMRPLDALARLLRGLGVPGGQIPVDVEEAAALYRSLLCDRRMLVVLDNAVDAEQVRPLLPASSGCMVVVTSRDQMTGLTARDGARRIRLQVLDHRESLTLLAQVAGEYRIDAEPYAADELVEACGGLPLALRIVGAHLLDDPNRRIADLARVVRGQHGLSALAVPGDPQVAVRMSFDLSYATLSADAQCVFRLFGVLPAVDLTAAAVAAAVAAHVAVQAKEAVLAELAAAHLVEERADGRFAPHDLLRTYAAEMAGQRDRNSNAAAVLRLLGWYLGGAEAAARMLYPEVLRLTVPPHVVPLAEPEFTGPDAAVAWLDAENHNLLSAISYARDRGPTPVAWLLADLLTGYYWQSRQVVPWMAAVEAGLAAAATARDEVGQSALYRGLGLANVCVGRVAAAVESLTAAAELARDAGWVDGQASAEANLALIHAEAGDLRRATEHATRALDGYRRSGRVAGQAVNLANLSGMHLLLGHVAQADAYGAEALVLYRRIGSRQGDAQALGVLGDVALIRGDIDVAQQRLTDALAGYRAIGSRYGQAEKLHSLARMYLVTGSYPQACRTIEEAQAICEQIDADSVLCRLRSLLARVHLAAGRPAEAGEEARRALSTARELDTAEPEVEALLALALVDLDAKPDLAVEHADEAVSVAHRASYRLLEAEALTIRAQAHLAVGRPKAAEQDARAALASHTDAGHRLGIAHCHLLLGQLGSHPDHHWQRALHLYRLVRAPQAALVEHLLDA